VILLRDCKEADESFIYDSWLRNHRHSKSNDHLDNDTYYTQQRALISQYIKEGSVVIACNEEDPSQIFGYIVFKKPNSLYYIFVKLAFRKMGVANLLMYSAFELVIKEKKTIFCNHSNHLFYTFKPKYNLVFKEKIK
jgi:ribosomal protein S18 acetylase RimI-like enzyme